MGKITTANRSWYQQTGISSVTQSDADNLVNTWVTRCIRAIYLCRLNNFVKHQYQQRNPTAQLRKIACQGHNHNMMIPSKAKCNTEKEFYCVNE